MKETGSLNIFIFEVLQAELKILDPLAVHSLCDILSPVNLLLASTLIVLHVASNVVKSFANFCRVDYVHASSTMLVEMGYRGNYRVVLMDKIMTSISLYT